MSLSFADVHHKDSASNPKDAVDSSPSGLFPLPLTPFELFLVLDEANDCPITSFIELHFSTPMQRDVLQAALHYTVHQHPLLASRLIEESGDLQWDYDPDFSPSLLDPNEVPILKPMRVGPSGSQSVQGCPRSIDLYSEPGCRYWYEQRELGKSRLTIQLHHATTDGVGLRRVLIDALSAYAQETTPESQVDPEWSSPKMIKRRKREEPILERLIDRADFSSMTEKPAMVKVSLWAKICNGYYFHFQRPQPLVTTQATRSQDASIPLNEPLRHHVLDKETSSLLLEKCRHDEVSLNDLSLTVLFRTCCLWNQIAGIEKPGTRIRVLMPFDLRSRADFQMPATNRLSFAFLGRTRQQCDDWASLLSSVQAETQWIKSSRVFMDFLDGLAALAPRPRWLKRVLHFKGSRNMATSVLTYTGDITRGMKNYFPEVDGKRRVGDTFLENILIAPPSRENTNVTMGLCINWGQVCISANWNRNAFTSEDCEAFLKIYVEEMMRFCPESDKRLPCHVVA